MCSACGPATLGGWPDGGLVFLRPLLRSPRDGAACLRDTSVIPDVCPQGQWEGLCLELPGLWCFVPAALGCLGLSLASKLAERPWAALEPL